MVEHILALSGATLLLMLLLMLVHYATQPRFRIPPAQVCFLTLKIKEIQLNKARLQATWTPSVSPNIQNQAISVAIGGENVLDKQLAKDVSTQVLPELYPAGTVLEVTVTTQNTLGLKSQTHTEFIVPDLEPPQPAANLGVSVVEVIVEPDVPDEPDTPPVE